MAFWREPALQILRENNADEQANQRGQRRANRFRHGQRNEQPQPRPESGVG